MPKIVVEGPDGKKYAFPDTMPREQINTFMKERYGTKARNETVNDYLARVVREQDATKARAKSVTKEATAAGRAEGERAAERMGVDNPFEMAMAAPAIGMAQQAGARPVFDREGTMLPDEAAGLAALNTAGFFIPGMVNQRFGERTQEGRRQQPAAAFAGDAAGGMIGGELIGLGLQKAGQAIAPGLAEIGRFLKYGNKPLVLGPERAVDPAKIAAAQEAGFNTDEVLFRGLRKPIEGEEFYGSTTPGYELQGMGVSLSEDAAKAAAYGDNVYPAMVRGKTFPESQYLARVQALVAGGMDARRAGGRVRSELEKEGYTALKADGAGLLDEGEVRVWENFDGPPNVRPVNASPLTLGPQNRILPVDRPDALPGDDVEMARALDAWTPPVEQQVRPMGFGGSKKSAGLRKPAVRYKGKTYEAETHGDALAAARKETGEEIFGDQYLGYTDQTGKFLQRDSSEAVAAALSANQITDDFAKAEAKKALRSGGSYPLTSDVLAFGMAKPSILTERGRDAVEQTFGAAYMSGTGSVAGGQYDLNGDGEIDNTDLAIGSGIGLAAFASPLALRKVAELGGRLKGTKAQGMAPKPPETPEQAPSLPTYKANPVKGQGFDEWLETLYSDAMRGPDNKTVLPNVFYRGMSDAEFEAAQKAGKFQSITNREGLYVEKDPTRYTGGGAYGAKRGGVIVQFDTTGLTPKTIRARTAGGFAEDGFDEIPSDKIARVWKWDPEKNDHVLVYEAEGKR